MPELKTCKETETSFQFNNSLQRHSRSCVFFSFHNNVVTITNTKGEYNYEKRKKQKSSGSLLQLYFCEKFTKQKFLWRNGGIVMYLRKILTDGNKEFLENMRVDFDYKGEHYNVRIKRLCDNFFE